MSKSPLPVFFVLAAVLLGSIAAGSAVISTHQPSVTSAAVPGAPTNLTAIPISATAAILTWSAPTSTAGVTITGYKIFGGVAAGLEGVIPIATTGASTLAYT